MIAMALALLLSVNSQEISEHCSVDECVGLNVAALVPARAGSKGIKHKNLSRLGNETILAKTLRTIHKSDQFISVWVSTDGKRIADEAISLGAQVHWRHPATATDEASTISVVKDFLQHHEDIEIIAVIQCTSPFIKAKFLKDAFQKMMRKNLDCIFSVTRDHSLRWTENKDGFVVPLNFIPLARPRRQDWNGEIIENGMFYFAKRNVVTVQETLQNDRCGILEIPKIFSMEVDTESDLILAKALLEIIDEDFN